MMIVSFIGAILMLIARILSMGDKWVYNPATQQWEKH